MLDPFIGQITAYPYSFPPKGWLTCEGQLLPIRQFTALFSLLGTMYGGDGKVTFALPNLSGRIPVRFGQGPGLSPYDLGEQAGVESVALDGNTMPLHGHNMTATLAQGTVNTAHGAHLANVFSGDFSGGAHGNVYGAGRPNTTLHPATVAPSGVGLPHQNIQPSLVLRYCIATQGVFPQRP